MKKVLVSAAVLTLFIGAGSVPAQALTDVEDLGKLLYESPLLSWDQTQSCATCHSAAVGFADDTAVSLGDNGYSTGGRNSPTSAYCGFSPILHREKGEYVGGMFWDGRATGHTRGDPLAEQAQGPPLNPVEMNMPDVQTIIDRISADDTAIALLFTTVYGADAFADVNVAYDNLARAIAAYERSTEVTRFTSRFDTGDLDDQELRGQKLFSHNCTTCRAMGGRGGDQSLFTNYKYVNAGVPMNEALLDPELNSAYEYPDLGLGGFLNDRREDGKFKVPTLRNIEMTAPYSHNGYFTTLTKMVSFMNDNRGFTPEVFHNLSKQVGNLHLTDKQVEAIVAFLNTLTDADLPVPTP